MFSFVLHPCATMLFLLTLCALIPDSGLAQTTARSAVESPANPPAAGLREIFAATDKADADSVITSYFNIHQGISSDDLIRRALRLNSEMAAARLDIERSRARLTQSRLRANPTIDFEQTTGQFSGARPA